ncbi:8819_t:CDS:1 [Funneliformis mosseae]|uniref:8819_t:CDS:1 n=1 Tax=Funneliformis mosseae TaxID=27381 RepID=A0A9N9HZW9_FUNMO|nr:8819_t:CDS:1 [Funneliformis mosseae]
MDIFEFIVENINNPTCEFNRKLARLLQTFTLNGNLNVPQAGNPATRYNVLTYFKKPSRIKSTHLRGVLRVIVSQAAQQIQINDACVISRATEMLKKAITFNERQGYRILASHVNMKPI